jgi:hypothetical protein
MTIFQIKMTIPAKATTVMLYYKDDNGIVGIQDPSVLAVTNSTLNEAINSATGKLFGGQPIRSYSRRRIFQGFHKQEKVNDAAATARKTNPDFVTCDK